MCNMTLCVCDSVSAEKHMEGCSDVGMLLEKGGGRGAVRGTGKPKGNRTLDSFSAVGCGSYERGWAEKEPNLIYPFRKVTVLGVWGWHGGGIG